MGLVIRTIDAVFEQ